MFFLRQLEMPLGPDFQVQPLLHSNLAELGHGNLCHIEAHIIGVDVDLAVLFLPVALLEYFVKKSVEALHIAIEVLPGIGMVGGDALGEIDDSHRTLVVDQQVELVEVPVDQPPGCESLHQLQ